MGRLRPFAKGNNRPFLTSVVYWVDRPLLTDCGLASPSAEALDAYFERNPPQAITPYRLIEEKQIRAQIALAAQHGYVLVDQEYEVGMRVFSMPLIDRVGQLQATSTLTIHASRMTVE